MHMATCTCTVVVHMVLLQQCQACSFYPVAFLDLRTYVLTCVCMYVDINMTCSNCTVANRISIFINFCVARFRHDRLFLQPH